MTPFTVPDVLLEIASFVGAPEDLSRLTQVDRLSHETIWPCLFRSIDIQSKSSLALLARTLRTVPHRAAMCRSLSLLTGGQIHEGLDADLLTLFGAISAHGSLEALTWTARAKGPDQLDQYWQLPQDVSTAVSSVFASLRRLDLRFSHSRGLDLDYLTLVRFHQLRVLRLDLSCIHGRESADLQRMLNGLPDLEELALEFPTCCGCREMTLASTHPHLKRFSFTSFLLGEVDSCNFLTRHPMIESLFLQTDQPFAELRPGNTLRALSVDVESTVALAPPNLQIPHLRLREIHSNALTPGVVAILQRAQDTLRCLEIEVFDGSISAKVTSFLTDLPALDELGITLFGAFAENEPLEILDEILTCLHRFSTVNARNALPASWIGDLAPLPLGLKYIQWDNPVASSIYVGILHYLGEPWTQ
ncbi:hypothetical protein C8R46DRAFT_1082093 [Mycena filopes]|nr:hypothetical protein C8R46DRAFT_1082093 [Mycena filopes]